MHIMSTPNTRHKISAVVIAYNDVPNMRRCLDSLDWVDEIVVVDSHSTDGTTEICLDYTDKVFQYAFEGFGALRNQAIRHATHDWIFSLDTDEWASREIQEEISHLLMEDPSEHAYFIPRRNYFLGRWIKHCGWYPDYRQPQLFHKAHMRYREDLVHEGFDVTGVTGILNSHVEQMPFRTLDQYFAKMERYSSLRAEVMHRQGRRFCAHQLFSHPVFTFIKMFVFRGGMLDRKPGLILSVLYAYYTFVKYAKLWELQKDG